ncbi:MAG: LPXTG cell wall anchor domain-containing protein, partial [Lachnospiraceae bacterium]|nr:LPXTG cell wall anchor domain-containing protein [Lachnospiraceae bacterium]
TEKTASALHERLVGSDMGIRDSSTTNGSIVLTPVYVAKEKPTTEEPTTEEPTTETPTTEEPTTEEPTTEASTAEDPIIQPPTTEAPTTETPAAGPVTGDSTNSIGVIGLGMLSLLGILVLTMKNKRKN